VKRIPAAIAAALAVLATGVATSACNVAPSAASVNGAVISVATLNAELRGLTTTAAGQCLLSLNAGQALDLTGVGAGGTGTYQLSLAAAVLDNRVYNLLAAQYLVGHEVRITDKDRALAKATFAKILDGEISAQAQQAAAVSGTAACQKADGSPYTGASLLTDLPGDVRDNELANQAIEQYLLARAADLGPTALQDYYAANPMQFVTVCLSGFATTDKTTADNAYNSLKAGTPLDQVASAASANPAAQVQAGAAGCATEARVLQQLQVTSLAVNQPIRPVQSNGAWVIYVPTSVTPQSPDQAALSISQILTRTPANERKVTNSVLGFARTASVEVNPLYGTWTGTRIATPTPPKARYLLPFTASAVSLPSTSPTSTGPVTPTTGANSAAG